MLVNSWSDYNFKFAWFAKSVTFVSHEGVRGGGKAISALILNVSINGSGQLQAPAT